MFLRDTADIFERTAIMDAFGASYTYGELDTLSLKYKNIIPERSLIMILCSYSIETAAFYYCQMTNQNVPILVDKDLEKNMLMKLIESYEPQYIWCPSKTKNHLTGFISDTLIQCGDYLLLKMIFKPYEMNPDLALLLTTSGSTGSLKLVRLSYENIRQNSSAFAMTVGLNENDRGITTMPMHYCFGLSVLHMHWLLGACIYITEYSTVNAKFWEFFTESKITNFFGVPYIFDILKQINFLEKDYSFLRFLLLGGGRLSDELQIEFGTRLREKGIKFYIGYGQTEATTCISVLSYKKIVEKPGSIGMPITGIDISVESPNENGEGELVCRSQSVSMGYSSDKKDLARDDENQGCLHTGDIVRVDEDGDIYIKGRKSRFVKILGARISLDELESLLKEHFMTVQFACIGTDNKIKICYTETEIEEKEILRFCMEKFNISKRMIQCRFMEEFPYTSSGKIAYRKL